MFFFLSMIFIVPSGCHSPTSPAERTSTQPRVVPSNPRYKSTHECPIHMLAAICSNKNQTTAMDTMYTCRHTGEAVSYCRALTSENKRQPGQDFNTEHGTGILKRPSKTVAHPCAQLFCLQLTRVQPPLLVQGLLGQVWPLVVPTEDGWAP
jgi:hypothetical protein